MRIRITGELVHVHPDRVELATDGGDVVHEVLVAPASSAELEARVGERITLHTREVLEAQGQGSSFLPRLMGFTSRDQRTMFELLTTVKGLGPRKALRSMNAPVGAIASAIASEDLAFLKTLPEIGKRTAEAICLDLRDKVGAIAPAEQAGIIEPMPQKTVSVDADTEQAVAALVHLGEQEASAKDLVRRALESEPGLRDAPADAILAAALAVRS
jgi:Holliday junction DNA helicase RuvA